MAVNFLRKRIRFWFQSASRTVEKAHVIRDRSGHGDASHRAAQRLARRFRRNGRPTAVLVGFSRWKTFMVDYLSDHNVVFLGHRPDISSRLIETCALFPRPAVFAWSYRWPPFLQAYCGDKGIELCFVEDGFIRGLGLGVARSRPLSLCFDKMAMHFDVGRPSELEALLSSHDFEEDPELLAEAERLRRAIICDGITKYNFPALSPSRAASARTAPDDGSILVLGQVDDDMSIKAGMNEPLSSLDLLRIAIAENPGRQVRFRPHPETRIVEKAHIRIPPDVLKQCEVTPPGEPLRESLLRAGRVYTMTSLAGFEAVLHGCSVKVFGAPFYAGWGFTEDVHPVSRRKRLLSPLEVLAGAYLLYPRYYNTATGAGMAPMEALRPLLTKADPLPPREGV